jgi:hypothetical protein
MFLGLPERDPLVRGTDPDPHQNVRDPQHWSKLTEALRGVYVHVSVIQ